MKETRNNFLKFNILLKKSVSTTKIKITNLKSRKDLNIGWLSNDQPCIPSLNNPGLENWIVVDKKKYKKNEINSQYELLNL